MTSTRSGENLHAGDGAYDALRVGVEHPAAFTSVISAMGDVDLFSRSVLGDAIRDEFHAGCGSVTIDLSGVTFMDSAGLDVLMRATVDAEVKRISLSIVVGGSAAVRRLLRATGTEGSFACWEPWGSLLERNVPVGRRSTSASSS